MSRATLYRQTQHIIDDDPAVPTLPGSRSLVSRTVCDHYGRYRQLQENKTLWAWASVRRMFATRMASVHSVGAGARRLGASGDPDDPVGWVQGGQAAGGDRHLTSPWRGLRSASSSIGKPTSGWLPLGA